MRLAKYTFASLPLMKGLVLGVVLSGMARTACTALRCGTRAYRRRR